MDADPLAATKEQFAYRVLRGVRDPQKELFDYCKRVQLPPLDFSPEIHEQTTQSHDTAIGRLCQIEAHPEHNIIEGVHPLSNDFFGDALINCKCFYSSPSIR